jgi:hypothetical protein
MGFVDEVGNDKKFMGYSGQSGLYSEKGSSENKTFNGQTAVPNIFEILGGFAKYPVGGGRPEKNLGRIFPKDEAPIRSSLPDLDRSLWVKGKFSNELEDPYRPIIEMPLRLQDTGEEYLFVASNPNALSAIKDLLGQCRKLPEGVLPVVRFDVASFKGKYGPIKKPIFTIVGKVSVEDDGKIEGPYDDEIPL